MVRLRTRLGLAITIAVSLAFCQGNGRLQIHFMDVGQGDAAVLISPGGETVLFDNGVLESCDKPISYLQQLGIQKLDYHVASHYHADHIGCTAQILAEFPLARTAFDRGGTYRSALFRTYLAVVGDRRETAAPGTRITLDAGTPHPVEIDIVATNGGGVKTANENDLSVVAVVHFDKFDAEMGGDLSGYKNGSYEDIESKLAGKVGAVEVYKVHHHASQYSSNENWLARTKPKVAIISVGDANGYGHPTQECLERLHAVNVRTYWTERGMGATPEPGLDAVVGNVVVEAEYGKGNFTVSHGNGVETYSTWEAGETSLAPAPLTYAWSKKSTIYHYLNCRFVANIAPVNLMQDANPPEGKTLHNGCPK